MKYLHTMIRVGNLEKSIAFYRDVLGMKLLSQKDYEGGRFTLAFLGYGSKNDPCIELTYNWDTDSYQLGDGYGHVALGVCDIYQTCEEVKKRGGIITREPGPMKHGTTCIAFIKDPDGYAIELIEQGTSS